MSQKGEHHDASLLHAEPSMATAPEQPALFRAKNVKWQEGTGTFKGVQVAVVYENPSTGNKAMFIKVPAAKKTNQKPETHYHTYSSHTVVIQGSIGSGASGKEFAVRPGDYFRAPAGWVHLDSHGGDPLGNPGDPVMLFTMIEGPRVAHGVEDLHSVRVHDIEPSMVTAPEMPALFRTKDVKWQEGTGTFKGVQVAVVHEDPATGNKAMFIKVPTTKNANEKPETHYHTYSSHTVVIQGSIASGANGKEIRVSAGDYFRAPARWVHVDSHGGDPLGHPGDPVMLFTVIEGPGVKTAGQHAEALESIPV